MGSCEVPGEASRTQGRGWGQLLEPWAARGPQDVGGWQAKWFKGHSGPHPPAPFPMACSLPPGVRVCGEGVVLQQLCGCAEHQVLSPAGGAHA